VRQLVDEADGIGHDDLAPLGRPTLAAGRVEGGEEHVGDVDIGAGKRVEERALPALV
jgi:hypothetical protein